MPSRREPLAPPARDDDPDWPSWHDGLTEVQAYPKNAPSRSLPPPVELPGYADLEPVGRGAMGVVYKARQTRPGRLVALKVILGGSHAGALERARFRQEADAVARLQHPNIVQIFEVGDHDGVSYLALEYVAGDTLDQKIAGQPQDPRESARLIGTLARAIHHAHQRGIVHRDLKPSNILLTLEGAPKITDFGIARPLASEDRLTMTGAVIGTPGYLAPEQAAGRRDVTAAADVYALGTILYELLTGRPPFEATTLHEVLQKTLTAEPLAPRRLRSELSRDLETICLKCLEKEPCRRYLSAAELADDLHRYLADEPVKARPVGVVERTWRRCRRNPVLASLCAAVLLLLTVVAVGGVVLSLGLREALGQARDAEHEGKRKLFEAYLSDANATRMSQQAGQRFGSLRRVRDALNVADEVGLSEEDRLRLRNVAVAALCLPDMEVGSAFSVEEPPEDLDLSFRIRLRAEAALKRVPGPAWQLKGVSWYSPDGRFVAVAAKPYTQGIVVVPVRVWRIDGPESVLVLEEPKGAYEDATAFRPDGRQVAFGHVDGSVSVYDTETGARAARLDRGPAAVYSLAFHPRLPRLAVTNGNEVNIWDLERKQRIRRLPVEDGAIQVAWHPRGHLLGTSGGTNEIKLWDVETGRPAAAPLRGHKQAGIYFSFNRGGDRLLSGDWNGTTRLWDSATGQLLLSLPGAGPWAALPFSPDDERVGPLTLDDGRRSRALRIAGGQELRLLSCTTASADERVNLITLHPGGRLVVMHTGKGLCLKDHRTGEETAFVPGSFDKCVLFDESGALWTSGTAGLLRWPVRPGPAAESLLVGPPELISRYRTGNDNFAVSADSRVVVIPRYQQGALLLHREPRRRALILGPHWDARHCWVSRDGRWAATRRWDNNTSEDARLKVWDASNGKSLAGLPDEVAGVCYGFTRDSRWLLTEGKTSRQLDVPALAAGPVPEEARRTPAATTGYDEKRAGQMTGVFSPDDRLVAFSAADGSVRLVFAGEDREVARLPGSHRENLGPCCFTPDGSQLLAIGYETGAVYAFDLRRLRAGLAELGLDWDAPPYPPVRAEGDDPASVARLKVEVIGGEDGVDPWKMSEAEARRARADLRANPRDADAHYRLGVRSLEINQPEAAFRHLSEARALGADEVTVGLARAVAALQLRCWADARADAMRCLEAAPHDLASRGRRAEANRGLRRYGEAVADYTLVIANYPDYAEFYELRAACHEANGDEEKARADRSKANELEPDKGEYLHGCAWTFLFGRGEQRDPNRALVLSRRALVHQPENGGFLGAYGAAQYRAGRFGESLETHRRALAVSPERTGWVGYFQAMAHVRLGDADRARECLARANEWVRRQKAAKPEDARLYQEWRAEAEALEADARFPVK